MRHPAMNRDVQRRHVGEFHRVVGRREDGFGEILPHFGGGDVEGRGELDVSDVVSPEPGVHQARNELVVGGVAIVLHALDEGRRAIPNTDDRDSDGSHGVLLR